MPYPFTPPDFLQNQSADAIHKRMMDAMPPDIDKSEAQIPWDYTRPPSLLKAEYAGFELTEAIKLIFPHWSYGEWLELHAEKVRVVRRAANKASGKITVKGTAGTIIPKGYLFATPASLTASVLFEVTEETAVGSGDTTDVQVLAVEGGNIGNVPPDTVKLMAKPISGISYVTNTGAITGGTPAEDDDSLIERVLSAMRSGSSFVGNNADYVRWAKEVAGVGEAICVPEANGAGTVALIIVDGNGIPANQQILDAVYDHIMGDGPMDISRLAPIGATLTVTAPVGIIINISATVKINAGENMGTIIRRLEGGLNTYWNTVVQETQQNEDRTGTVRITKVGAVLSVTKGILDYTDLRINGGEANIEISQEEYPVTGTVTLNEAGVFAIE